MNGKNILASLILVLLLDVSFLVPVNAAWNEAEELSGESYLFLPIITEPLAAPPVLSTIDNADHDNRYTVTWNPTGEPFYTLEESPNSSFSPSHVKYKGSETFWTVPTLGKPPDTYYYRVKGGNGGWSNVGAVTILPLYVYFQAQWDGVGYILTDYYKVVGFHLGRLCFQLSDIDTLECASSLGYDPDPEGWGRSFWTNFYSLSTGYFLSSSEPSDPAWKWGYYWLLPYDISFADGQTISIDSQKFNVTGPHLGATTFGKQVYYWKLVNKEKFLFVDEDPDWKQYVNAGDATLWYEAGNTRLLLHNDVRRTYYYQGEMTSFYVHYIGNLTSSTSFPGSVLSGINASPKLDTPASSESQPAANIDFTELQIGTKQIICCNPGKLTPRNDPS